MLRQDAHDIFKMLMSTHQQRPFGHQSSWVLLFKLLHSFIQLLIQFFNQSINQSINLLCTHSPLVNSNIPGIHTALLPSSYSEEQSIQPGMKRGQRSSHAKNIRVYKFPYLVNTSRQQVRFVCGNATRIPDMSGEWRTTAPTSYLDARSTVGTVPMLCP